MKMKKTGHKIFSAMLAFALCASLFLPVQAAHRHDRADYLFRNSIDGGEKQPRVTIKDKNDDEIEVELPIIARENKGDLTLKTNAEVMQELQLTVRKGTTLTIDSGVTLTVLGDLIIDGTLINNGTLIVGDRYTFNAKDMFEEAAVIKAVSARMSFNQVTVNGSFKNTGKITVREGTVVVRDNGTLSNSGTITLGNGARNSAGLRAITTKKGATTTIGTITNTGTIYVRNTTKASNGIHIFGGSKLTNNGAILTNKTGSIQGRITGTQPKREA